MIPVFNIANNTEYHIKLKILDDGFKATLFRDNKKIGKLSAALDYEGETMEILDLEIYDHSNEAIAIKNPHPGAGRLLVYISCEYAMTRSVQQVSLFSVGDARGFYRNLGMRTAAVVDRTLPFPDGRPAPVRKRFGAEELDEIGLSVGGKLNPEWLSEFSYTLGTAFDTPYFTQSISIMLDQLRRPVTTQWQIPAELLTGF